MPRCRASVVDDWTQQHLTDAVIVTDPTYATRDVYDGQPIGVLIDDNSQVLAKVAERFHATPKKQQPLLMHMYLPKAPMQAFATLGLPRPGAMYAGEPATSKWPDQHSEMCDLAHLQQAFDRLGHHLLAHPLLTQRLAETSKA